MKSRPFGAIFPQKREKVPESWLFWRKQDASLAPPDMAEPRKAAKNIAFFIEILRILFTRRQICDKM